MTNIIIIIVLNTPHGGDDNRSHGNDAMIVNEQLLPVAMVWLLTLDHEEFLLEQISMVLKQTFHCR